MLNLQILSGVHKGAELELSAAGLRLGYGAQCDIELLDLGFEVLVHVSYDHSNNVFSVSDPAGFSRLVSSDGEVLTTGRAQHSAFLFLGPVIVYLGPLAGEEMLSIPQHIANKHQNYQSKQEESNSALDTETPLVPEENQITEPLSEPIAPIKSSGVNKPVLLCLFGCLAMFVMVLFIVIAPAEKSSYSQVARPAATLIEAPVASETPVEGSGSEGGVTEISSEFPESESALRWLASAFDEARLSQYLEVAQVGRQIVLKGALSEKDTLIFEGVISDWQNQFGQGFTLIAEIRKPINELPFKIREVNPGPQGWIVTTENHYLYLGGIYKGFRLDRVERNRVVFGGKATLDITL